MTIFTVEIPHNGNPVAWIATDESDFIAKVAATHDNFEYTEYDTEHLAAVFGDDAEDHPDNIAQLVSQHGKCIALDRGHGPELLAPHDAPSEFEAAKQFNAHDLSGSCTSTNLEDLREYVRSDDHWRQALPAIDQLAE